MTYISFCSGIEAATAAWHPLGWSPVAFCEIDKFASRVLAHHYPDVPNLGDFTKVDWSQYSADICVGGTPCQAFSVAGLRNSLADERGNLTLEFVRAINIIRPHTIVWENVPGVLSTADNAFGCFLAALVGCDEPIVFEQGWPNSGVVDGPDRRAAWRILDAQFFGLAQRRKRVFVVANSGDRPHPAEILLEWESLRRDSSPSRTSGEGVAGTVAARTTGGGGFGTDFEAAGGLQPVAMCLGAKGGVGRMDAESETFVASCIGVDEEQNAAVELMGCLKARCKGGGQEAFVTHALTASADQGETEDGTGRGCPLVPVGFQETGQGYWMQHEVACGLRDMSAGSGAAIPNVITQPVGRQENSSTTVAVTTLAIRGRGDESNLEYRTDGTANALLTPNGGRAGIGVGAVAYAIQAGATRENPESGPDGVGVQSDIAYTIEARQEVQAVSHMAVRRLTPEECEALQGFPRGFTNISGYDPAKTGEFGGNKGVADGPRYRALGNSMAVPVMAWIGQRIKEAYANHQTLPL